MSLGVTNVQTTEDLYAQQQASMTTGPDNNLGKDAFLKLMVTQLQHQDPLNPMDNNAFLDQLAQLSQVEQAQTTNGKLDEMLMGLNAVNNATMVNLVGQEVKALHDGFYYEGSGTEDLHFELASPADRVTIGIYDEDGALVATETLDSVPTGVQTFTWDGMSNEGQTALEGQYTFKVSAVDSEGAAIDVNHYLIGTIEELDYSTGFAVPIVDEQVLSISQIVSLVTPTEDEDAP